MVHFAIRPTLALTLTAFAFVSSAVAQHAGRAGIDGSGDPLPPNALARIGTTQLRHAAAVSSLAYSPDGKRISSATIWFDNGVWDARTGKSLAFRSGRQVSGLFRASVSPDGSLFAGRTNNRELGVQETLSGKMIHRFAGKTEMCDGLVFSRDNRWLASADGDGNVFLWDLIAGKLSHEFKAKVKTKDIFDSFHHDFTPDGTVLIQAGTDEITFWNVQTGKVIRRIESTQRPGGIAVSPDGELLAVRAAYGRVDLWQTKTGQHVRRIADQWNEVGPVFSPDSKLILTSGRESGICFWDVASATLVRTLPMPAEEHPESFAISPDGKTVASGGSDHAIHLWDLTTGKELLPVEHRLGGTPTARILPDGKTLLMHCRYDVNQKYATIYDCLSYWNLQGHFVRQAKLAPGKAHAFELSADARTVAYGSGPNFGFMFRPVPNGWLRSSIRLCDLATGTLLINVEDVPCQIHDFTFSPDDRFLLVNAFNAGKNSKEYDHIDTLQIWKRKSPASLEKVADIPVLYFLSGYCVSPDSRWVVVTSTSGCCFHDCETGKLIRSYPNTPGSVVAVSPSGRVLVSRDDKDARQGKDVIVWERATGNAICKLDLKPGQTDWCPLVVSSDGKYVAGALNREVIAIWDTVTGKQIGRLVGHRGDISSLCFSPDGHSLISAFADTTILVWDWKKILPKAVDTLPLTPECLEHLWQDLQASDPKVAYQAIAILVASPGQAIELLKAKTPADKPIEPGKFKQWIGELDDANFKVREKATKELTDAGELAEAALREAIAGTLSEEARERVAQVLDSQRTAVPHATTLATIRLLEVLEMINTPETRTLIEKLTQATGDTILKREALQTLARIKRKL